jgi:hypothetical protein
MKCQRCQSERFTKEGHDRVGRQVYRRTACRRRRTEHSASAFAGYCFPPDVIALAVVLPEVTRVTSKLEQQVVERDHQHLKGRYRPMRGFKQPQCAQIVCAGHGFMRNMRDGFYRLGFVWRGPRLPHPPRLLTAWNALTAIVCVA